MRTFIPFVVLLCLLFFFSCQKDETPDYVTESYEDICKNLDEDAIGKSILELEAFKSRTGQYKISEKVSEKIENLRKKVKGQYAKARDLAREENLERAEKILEDLAIHFSDTTDGKMAKKYLRFEYPMFKANRLLMNRKLDEAKTILTKLQTKELTANETQHLERLLDSISTTQKAVSFSGERKFKAACRMLLINLKRYRGENGEYPNILSLDSDKLLSKNSDVVRESISNIENYSAGKDKFSLTAVGKDPKNRAKVTQKGVE